jgi:hypothetical protein
MKFKEGDILEFDGHGPYAAEKGATAICRGYKIEDGIEYVQVEWIINELSKGQTDGGYNESQFTKVEIKIKEKVMEFNFEEGKQRIIKLLENHIDDFTHDMMQDIRGVINGDREEVLDQIEDIIKTTRTNTELNKNAISKIQAASSVFEVLEAVEDTVFEEMEMEILTELFGLGEIIRRT